MEIILHNVNSETWVLLRQFQEADAAGIVRPGLVIEAEAEIDIGQAFVMDDYVMGTGVA